MKARLVRSKSNTALIESEDGTERRVVPVTAIRSDGNGLIVIDELDWQRGIEQDLNITEICIPVDAIKREFHRRGIYATADIKSHLAVARAALLDAAGEQIARLLNGG